MGTDGFGQLWQPLGGEEVSARHGVQPDAGACVRGPANHIHYGHRSVVHPSEAEHRHRQRLGADMPVGVQPGEVRAQHRQQQLEQLRFRSDIGGDSAESHQPVQQLAVRPLGQAT